MFSRCNSCTPKNAAVPACLLLSRKNPIHKQVLKTVDGDWFPERSVSVCASLYVYVSERMRGRDGARGGGWGGWGENLLHSCADDAEALEQRLEWTCGVCACTLSIIHSLYYRIMQRRWVMYCDMQTVTSFCNLICGSDLSLAYDVTVKNRCGHRLRRKWLFCSRLKLFFSPLTLSPPLRHSQCCSRLSSLSPLPSLVQSCHHCQPS